MNILSMTHRQRVEHFVKTPPILGSNATEFRRGRDGARRPMSAPGSVGAAAFEAGRKVRDQLAATDVVQYVVFTYPGRTPEVVRIEEAFEWADRQPLRWEVNQVIWKSGSHSWAKGRRSKEDGRLRRIGAGAYGDLVVAER